MVECSLFLIGILLACAIFASVIVIRKKIKEHAHASLPTLVRYNVANDSVLFYPRQPPSSIPSNQAPSIPTSNQTSNFSWNTSKNQQIPHKYKPTDRQTDGPTDQQLKPLLTRPNTRNSMRPPGDRSLKRHDGPTNLRTYERTHGHTLL